MDDFEATRIVFSRIQSLDPENASKIMGLLLLQDHAEKEMIRLAFSPEALVHSVILKAKKELGIAAVTSVVPPASSSPSTPSTPSFPSPFLTNPMQNSLSSKVFTTKIPPPLIIPNLSSSDLPKEETLTSSSKGSILNPASLPFYGNGISSEDVMEDFPLEDQSSFLTDGSNHQRSSSDQLFCPLQRNLSSSPLADNAKSTDFLRCPSYWGSGSPYRSSLSVSDVLWSDDHALGLGGCRPCLYFARGYCKNGSSCRFVHGDQATAFEIGSPGKIEMMEQCVELLRSTPASQHQRLIAAAQLMGGYSFPFSPKGMNFLLQQQQNENQRSKLERSDLYAAMASPASRQIYLTFPADSTFKDEDVSNYFSIYGPVQEVRIPYQQKRMFGFVTFVYPETVIIILAKGNPHFVCDSRVLVKPYKEKGKIPYRNKQQIERSEFSSPGGTPGLDSRDPFDLQPGARMFCNGPDNWRRKLKERPDLQEALELQSRRLMNLRLLDVNKHHHLHHHRALSSRSPLPLPTYLCSPNPLDQSHAVSPFHGGQESPCLGSLNSSSEIRQMPNGNKENGNDNESPIGNDVNLPLSLEHNLLDSPFASPAKASTGKFASFFEEINGAEKSNVCISASSSFSNDNATIDMAPFKSYNCQMPRFSSGHEAMGMHTGNAGPTCPVGI